MEKRTYVLIFCAALLGAIYIYKFTDWFEEKEIQIIYRNLSPRGGGRGAMETTFYLNKEYPLTAVKVVSVDEAATNKYPHALWQLVSESNSVPVGDFIYGESVAGMKTKIAGVAAEPLLAGAKYRIMVEAGRRKGEKVFQKTRE